MHRSQVCKQVWCRGLWGQATVEVIYEKHKKIALAYMMSLYTLNALNSKSDSD